MAIRKILSDQEPELHKKCHYITKFDDKLSSLLDDLKETLADASGAGLAAPQIGILRRAVIVINEDGEMLDGWYEEDGDIYYLNGEDEGWRAQSQWLWLAKPDDGVSPFPDAGVMCFAPCGSR